MFRVLAPPSALVLSILGGIVGLLLGAGLLHLYTDHQAFHVVLDFLNQHAATIATPATPAGQP